MSTTASMNSERVVTKELVGEALTINDVTIDGIESSVFNTVPDKLITRSTLDDTLASIDRALKSLDPEGDLFQDLSVISLSLVDNYFSHADDWLISNWFIQDNCMWYNKGTAANFLKINPDRLTNPGHYVCIITVGNITGGKLELRLNSEWVATLRENKEYVIEVNVTDPTTDIIELVAVDVSTADIVRLDSFGFHFLTNRFYKYLITKVASMVDINPANYVTQERYQQQQDVLAAQFRSLVASCRSELTTHINAVNPHNITPESIGAAPVNHTHSEYVSSADVANTVNASMNAYARRDHVHTEYMTLSRAYSYLDEALANKLEGMKVVDPFIVCKAAQAKLPSRYAQTDVTPAITILVPSTQSNDSTGSLDYENSIVTTNKSELMSEAPCVFSADTTKRAYIPLALLDSVVNFRIEFNHKRSIRGYIIHCYGINKLIDWKVITGNTTFIHRISNPSNYVQNGNDNSCEISFDSIKKVDSLSFMFMGAYTGDPTTDVVFRIELLYTDLTMSAFGITNEGYELCIPDDGANFITAVPPTPDITAIIPSVQSENVPVYVYANVNSAKQIEYITSYYPIEVSNVRKGVNVLLDKFKNINRSALHQNETYIHPAYGALSLASGRSDSNKELKTIYDSDVNSWYSDGNSNQVIIKQTIDANNIILKGYMLNWRNTDLSSIPDTWTLTVKGIDSEGIETTVVFDSVDRYYPFYSVEDDDIVYHCKFDNPLIVKEITLTMSTQENRAIALNKLFLYLSEYYYAPSENTMYLGTTKVKTTCIGSCVYSNTKGWKVRNTCIGRSCVVPVNNLDMTEPYTTYTVVNPFNTTDIVVNVCNYVLTDLEAQNNPDSYIANINPDYITVYCNAPFRHALSISRTW